MKQQHRAPGKRKRSAPEWRFTTLGGAVVSPETPKPRLATLSIALPADVLSNCQTLELKTLLIGQVARAACIYEADEVVLLAECKKESSLGPKAVGERPKAAPEDLFARVLQYMETPQYLRRQLVPMHAHLRAVGLLAPLDAPHHLRQRDRCPFREGAVLDRPGEEACLVNCGLPRPLRLDRPLEKNMRVTVKVIASSLARLALGGTSAEHRKGSRNSLGGPLGARAILFFIIGLAQGRCGGNEEVHAGDGLRAPGRSEEQEESQRAE